MEFRLVDGNWLLPDGRILTLEKCPMEFDGTEVCFKDGIRRRKNRQGNKEVGWIELEGILWTNSIFNFIHFCF